MKEKEIETTDYLEEFKPSAPIPTGTLPRHGNRPPKTNAHGHIVDVDENEAVPSAPPLELMDHVVGYESVSFDAISVPPPYFEAESPEAEISNRDILPNCPQVTEQDARTALLSLVAQHCCYGKDVAKEMAITKINYSSAFHYQLHSFTEKRETSWAYSPYGGGEVDGVENGAPPLPWEIECYPGTLFEDEVKLIPVPHTSSVKSCHRCKGGGSLLCAECHGKGWVRCLSCHGDGWSASTSGYKERCFYCHSSTHGHGRQDCLKCNAKGRVPCPTCDNYGQIQCFIQLTISWKVNSAEHIVERLSLPEDLVKSVSGQVAFEEEAQQVLPIGHFPDETINMASTQIVHAHAQAFSDQKLIRQKQVVRIIPVTEINYRWKNKNNVFYVFGFENRAYAPDYPQKCCCGCTIL
ncbi:protein SSUH2 homolog isoform X1 [Cloeon dipterum]|uniref:protein SSUH2 homolog isoform X1 n=1 Tax=Cloeon dipterum TaxID=197152 RepID=UPI00321F86AA